MGRTLRVGNAAGFWGDQPDAPRDLVRAGKLDYLTLEYLAELTLSILAYQKSKNPDSGFVTEVPRVIESIADSLRDQSNLRVVTNGGGMNPQAAAKATSQVLVDQSLGDLKVGCAFGDDLMPSLDDLMAKGETFTNLETGRPLSDVRDRVVSANAYLGAAGIVRSLEEGARIVLTGRVADASLIVGPALFEFGWDWNDWERLARATVAGHLIECGAQSTGGIFSLWDPALIDLANVGYPIAELHEDGNCVITKPLGTGGVVTTRSVAEQLVYEIGDPRHYLTPDVDADFADVELEQVDVDRVAVTNGKGQVAPETLKVSLAYKDGFMVSGTLVIVGRDAVSKAEHTAELIRKRMNRAGIELDRYGYEVIGSGDTIGRVCGEHAQPWDVMLRITARDQHRETLERFVREFAPMVTSGPPGVTGYTGTRPRPHPVFSYWPTTVSRENVSVEHRVATAAQWCESSGLNAEVNHE